MKRKSNLVRRYMMFRIVPYISEYNTGMIMKTIALKRPEVRYLTKSNILEVIQRVPKGLYENKHEFELKDALKKEAQKYFEGYRIKEVFIKLEYE